MNLITRLLLHSSVVLSLVGCKQEQRAAGIERPSIRIQQVKPDSSQPQHTGDQEKGNTSSINTSKRVVEDEALALAEEVWGRIFLSNEQDWFTKDNNHPITLQIRGRTVEVFPTFVSDVDRMNGIEWKGGVWFKSSAERLHFSREYQIMAGRFKQGWTDWYERKDGFIAKPVIALSLSKRNGKWQVVNESPTFILAGESDAVHKPSIEDILKINLDQ